MSNTDGSGTVEGSNAGSAPAAIATEAVVAGANGANAGVDAGPGDGDDDEEEIDLVEGFEQLFTLIERAEKHVAGDKFFAKLQNRTAPAIRDELRDNVLPMLKKVIFWCGRHALQYEETEGQVAEMGEELERQGRLLRDMATGSVLTLSAALANAVLQRSQDEDLRAIAQSVIASLGPIGVQHIHAHSSQENPGKDTGSAQQSPQVQTNG